MITSNEEFDDEIVNEEDEQSPLALKKLREKLAQAVKEKQEYLEGWQRSRADFTNYKKEELVGFQQKEERLRAELFSEFLPALNTLEHAIKNPEFAKASDEWKKGFDAVWKQCLKSVAHMGITAYAPTPNEDTFDPSRDELLREVPTKDSTMEHKIAEVHRMGYSIGDRIIQPAQVSVYSYKQ